MINTKPISTELFREVTSRTKPIRNTFFCRACKVLHQIAGRRLREVDGFAKKQWVCGSCANEPK
jgi:hypothetical protein